MIFAEFFLNKRIGSFLNAIFTSKCMNAFRK